VIIAVDFDGTCVEHKFPDIGEPLPGAIETIKALQDAGHRLILWTCRRGVYLKEACRWLCEEGVDPLNFALNRNLPDVVEEMGGDTRKVYADVYIDDRNLGGFPGWDAVRAMLLADA